MKLKFFLLALFALISLVGYQKYSEYSALKSINSYDSCVSAKGSIIQESYPSTCVTRLGTRFTQLIAPAPELSSIPESSIKPISDYSNDYSFNLSSEWRREGNAYLNYAPNDTDTNFKPSKDKGKLVIEVNRMNDISNLQEALSSVKVYSDQKYTEKQITIDNQKALLVESDSGIFKSSVVLVQNQHTQDYYSILFGLDFYNYKTLRDQILSTFKFTN